MREEPFALKLEGFDLAGALYVPVGAGVHPGLIISHGIPAGVQDPRDRGYPALAERFCAGGFLTAIFNFRGCGLSGGDFEIRGWTRDLAAVTDYMAGRPELDARSLALMGFSGGAAASVYQGARDKRVTAVVSCSCPAVFEHFRDEAASLEFLERARQIGIIRKAGYPASLRDWMAGFEEVAPVLWVAGIAPRPLLLLHGSQDDLIPVEQAWELHRAAGEPKEIRIIEGAGHKLRTEEQAMGIALEWLRARAGCKPAPTGGQSAGQAL